MLFVPGRLFRPSLMFVGKAKSLPYSEAHEWRFTRVGHDHTQKHKVRLESLPWTLSLLRPFVNYGREQFYSTGSRTCGQANDSNLINDEAILWQISSGDSSIVGAEEEENVGLELTNGVSAGLVTDIEGGNLKRVFVIRI